MDRSNVYNVLHLGFGFLLIFMSFGVAQIFQTSSDHARNGAIALGILYASFCFTNLAFSSYLTRIIGVRITLIVSSLAYVSFVACNIYYNVWALLIVSFLLGISSALFWTAQGVYVSQSTSQHETINILPVSSTHGLMNGAFFALFQLSQTLGNLTASLLFYLQLRQWIIFAILTAIGGCGTLSLAVLRPVKLSKDAGHRSVLSTLSLFRDIRLVFLIPAMCYSGFLQSFIFSAVPPLIIDKSRKFLIFGLLGTVNATSSIIFGRLSDYFGRRLPILLVGVLANSVLFALLLTVWQPPLDQTRIEIFITLAFGLGLSDAIFTTQLYAILGMLFGETRPSEAFACFKLFQAGFTALGFLQQTYLSFRIRTISLVILLTVTTFTLVIGHYRFSSLDLAKSTTVIAEDQHENPVAMESEMKRPLTTPPATA